MALITSIPLVEHGKYANILLFCGVKYLTKFPSYRVVLSKTSRLKPIRTT